MAGPGQHYNPMASRGPLTAPQMMAAQPSMGGFIPPASQMTSGPGPGPGIQHQQSFPGPGPSSATMQHNQPHMVSPTKQVNTVSLCKRGQETNQELVNKVLEVFRQFKQMQVKYATINSYNPFTFTKYTTTDT